MIVPDVNLLLYAWFSKAEWHEAAHRWLQETLSGSEPVGFTWSVLQGFLRIAANPRIMQPAASLDDATAVVDGWLDRPGVSILVPGNRHWSVFRGLIVAARCTGPLVPDAHLAALAIEYGATLCSADHGFQRFAGLRFYNPLTGSARD